jgi:hypothetical protein
MKWISSPTHKYFCFALVTSALVKKIGLHMSVVPEEGIRLFVIALFSPKLQGGIK